MKLFYLLLRMLVSSDSLSQTIHELFQVAGIAAVALVLLIGFIFFLPTIISGLRKARLRGLICIVNLVLIATAFFNSILPLVIWLILMALAITGKKDTEKIETTGVKITYSHREDD